MVARLVQNPLVKGVRVRNKKMSRRVNKTGRHRSVNAPPEERLERHCPHLAFIDAARFDRVNALLKERNARYARGKSGVDCRKGVPGIGHSGRGSTWIAAFATGCIAMEGTG